MGQRRYGSGSNNLSSIYNSSSSVGRVQGIVSYGDFDEDGLDEKIQFGRVPFTSNSRRDRDADKGSSMITRPASAATAEKINWKDFNLASSNHSSTQASSRHMVFSPSDGISSLFGPCSGF
jgi:hypothetical protein